MFVGSKTCSEAASGAIKTSGKDAWICLLHENIALQDQAQERDFCPVRLASLEKRTWPAHTQPSACSGGCRACASWWRRPWISSRGVAESVMPGPKNSWQDRQHPQANQAWKQTACAATCCKSEGGRTIPQLCMLAGGWGRLNWNREEQRQQTVLGPVCHESSCSYAERSYNGARTPLTRAAPAWTRKKTSWTQFSPNRSSESSTIVLCELQKGRRGLELFSTWGRAQTEALLVHVMP